MEEGEDGTNLKPINKSKNNNVMVASPVKTNGILDDSLSSGSAKAQMILKKVEPQIS